MKILIISPEYPPNNIGGGGIVIQNLAQELSKIGNKIYIAYGKYNPSFFEKPKIIIEDNIEILSLPEIILPKYFNFLDTVLPPSIRSIIKLYKYIKNTDPDIVNIHGYGQFFPAIGARIVRLLGYSYVLTLHGAPISQKHRNILIKIFYRFYKVAFGNFLINHASAITSVSEFTKSFDEFKQVENIIKIENGIKTDKLNLAVDNNILSPFILDNEITFFSLGRIEKIKGYDLFLPILLGLKEMGIKFKYFIGGSDKGFKQDLQKMIDELGLNSNIIFLGQLDFYQKSSAFKYCDYFVLPSIIENYPGVLLEAIYFRKISICNNVGGIPEIVNENTGLLLDMKDCHKSIDLTYKLLTSDAIKTKLIKYINEIKLPTWDIITWKYLKVFKDVVKNNKSKT